MECTGDFFILNGKVQSVEMFDDSLVNEGVSIYEVIRVIAGHPVFFVDHYGRFKNSSIQTGRQMLVSEKNLEKDIAALVAHNHSANANVKIVMNYSNGRENYMAYNIKSVYPTEKQYEEGVKGTLIKAVRIHPESKVINTSLRSSANDIIKKNGAYEALLVNDHDEITEGSRSNTFFIKDHVLYTAPEELVLCGITRKYILQICRKLNLTVLFQCVHVAELDSFDAAVMTGTSPVVLPYRCIDHLSFSCDLPLIKQLRDELFYLMTHR